MAEVTVEHDIPSSRYVLLVDGRPSGFVAYVRSRGEVRLTHTEVDPSEGGKGLGTALVRRALDDLRASGELVVAQCPFVAAFIRMHPEYADLVARRPKR